MLLGKCKVCEERLHRIDELKTQIQMLTKLAFPSPTTKNLSVVDLERDRILSGSDEAIPVNLKSINDEAASILMGSYDHSQIEVE